MRIGVEEAGRLGQGAQARHLLVILTDSGDDVAPRLRQMAFHVVPLMPSGGERSESPRRPRQHSARPGEVSAFLAVVGEDAPD